MAQDQPCPSMTDISPGEDELSLYGQDYTFTTTQSSFPTPTNVYGNNITVEGFGG